MRARSCRRDGKIFLSIAENANIQALVFLSLVGASAAGILVPNQSVGDGQKPPAMVVRIGPDGRVGVDGVGEVRAQNSAALCELLLRGAAANSAVHMRVHATGCDAAWVKVVVDFRPSSVASMTLED